MCNYFKKEETAQIAVNPECLYDVRCTAVKACAERTGSKCQPYHLKQRGIKLFWFQCPSWFNFLWSLIWCQHRKANVVKTSSRWAHEICSTRIIGTIGTLTYSCLSLGNWRDEFLLDLFMMEWIKYDLFRTCVIFFCPLCIKLSSRLSCNKSKLNTRWSYSWVKRQLLNDHRDFRLSLMRWKLLMSFTIPPHRLPFCLSVHTLLCLIVWNHRGKLSKKPSQRAALMSAAFCLATALSASLKVVREKAGRKLGAGKKSIEKV